MHQRDGGKTAHYKRKQSCVARIAWRLEAMCERATLAEGWMDKAWGHTVSEVTLRSSSG